MKLRKLFVERVLKRGGWYLFSVRNKPIEGDSEAIKLEKYFIKKDMKYIKVDEGFFPKTVSFLVLGENFQIIEAFNRHSLFAVFYYGKPPVFRKENGIKLVMDTDGKNCDVNSFVIKCVDGTIFFKINIKYIEVVK